MAITVKTTITKTSIDDKGVSTIEVEFDDGVGKWSKTYTYHQTEAIDFTNFKNMIITDLRKDLKVKTQLTNLAPQVGKSFNLSI